MALWKKKEHYKFHQPLFKSVIVCLASKYKNLYNFHKRVQGPKTRCFFLVRSELIQCRSVIKEIVLFSV